MFNSPILDVVIGLVFVFLLYSLLATALNEAIASIFALRARMLKNAIVESMLADTPTFNRLQSILKGFGSFFAEVYSLFFGKSKKPVTDKKIGDHFFDHPIIKSYGSSRIFPTPSYISTSSFSTAFTDVLKQEFNTRIPEIAAYKQGLPGNTDKLENIEQGLLYSTDIVKIKEIIDYYGRYYAGNAAKPYLPVIDREAWYIMNLHLRNSLYSIEKFTKNIEGWFDDSMNRVSGWYKRQVQFILFTIGVAMAVLFNVDTIELSGRLSNDKDARDKLVQMAVQATDKYKDDPKVKKISDMHGTIMPDTSQAGRDSNNIIFKEYQARADSIKNFLTNDLSKANDIVALGWGDFGKKRDSSKVIECYKKQFYKNVSLFFSNKAKDSIFSAKDSLDARNFALAKLYNDDHWITLKIGYVFKEMFGGKKFLGFLLTAFAISMGAPFWFDLLNKLVRLRAAGKKESGDSGSNTVINNNQPPVTLNVNTQTGVEAVG
jgi:hypothetical protein